MAETAAHLVDHVFPPLPVRQWVLAVPKRLRYDRRKSPFRDCARPPFALVPPPRAHRHRYYGVLAPNAPLRAVVTALAPAAVSPAPTSAATHEASRHRAVARYLWAMLLARIYEDFPLQCPICHASMRIIAFINEAGTVKKILDHIGESTQPPRIAPARGPPLGEAAAEQATGGAGGAIRELYGGAEDFLMRDRRLTQATTVEDTPECRVGFPILGGFFCFPDLRCRDQ